MSGRIASKSPAGVLIGFALGALVFSIISVLSAMMSVWYSGALTLPNGQVVALIPLNMAWFPGLLMSIAGVIALLIMRRANNLVLAGALGSLAVFTLVGIFGAKPDDWVFSSFEEALAVILASGSASPAVWMIFGFGIGCLIFDQSRAAGSDRRFERPDAVGGND